MVGKIPRPDRVGTRKNRSSRSDSGLARHGGLVVWDGRRDPSSRSDSGLARHRGLAAWDGRRDPSSLRSLPSAALRAGGMTMPRCIVRWPTEVVRYKGRTRECGSFGRTAWNDADGRRVRAGLIPIRLGTALRFVGPGWASAKPGSLPAGWESTTRGRCRASRQSTRDAKSAKARRYMDRQKTDRFGRDEGEGRACVRRAGLWYKEMRKAHRPSYGGQGSLGCTRDERVPFGSAGTMYRAPTKRIEAAGLRAAGVAKAHGKNCPRSPSSSGTSCPKFSWRERCVCAGDLSGTDAGRKKRGTGLSGRTDRGTQKARKPGLYRRR